jgi:hypothetical protein
MSTLMSAPALSRLVVVCTVDNAVHFVSVSTVKEKNCIAELVFIDFLNYSFNKEHSLKISSRIFEWMFYILTHTTFIRPSKISPAEYKYFK